MFIRSRSINLITGTVLMVLLFISCEPQVLEVDMSKYAINPHLILNGILYVGKDTNKIYISEGVSIFSPENRERATEWNNYGNYLRIPDAQMQIWKNDVEGSSPIVNPEDSVFRLIGSLQPNDRVAIRVADRGRIIDAQTKIPHIPEIVSIDTSTFYSGSNKYLRFKIKIKDHPEEKNYYRLLIERYEETHYDSAYIKEWEVLGWKQEAVQKYSSFDFYTEDPVLTGGNPENIESDIEIIKFKQNYFRVFNDNLFNSTAYTLDAYINFMHRFEDGYNLDPKWSDETYWKGGVRIHFQSISEELYLYYTSLQHYLFTDDDMIEPIRVFSNVNNGLGIWGSVNEVSVPIMEKELKRE